MGGVAFVGESSGHDAPSGHDDPHGPRVEDWLADFEQKLPVGSAPLVGKGGPARRSAAMEQGSGQSDDMWLNT